MAGVMGQPMLSDHDLSQAVRQSWEAIESPACRSQGGFLKIMGTFWGVPMIGTVVF